MSQLTTAWQGERLTRLTWLLLSSGGTLSSALGRPRTPGRAGEFVVT